MAEAKTTGITAEERRLRSERLLSRVGGICEGFDAGASVNVKEQEDKISALEAELAAAKRDSERLNWLESKQASLLLDDFGEEADWQVLLPLAYGPYASGKTARGGIDAAMSQEGGNG